MCWNVEVSAASTLVGWAACAYLLHRGGPRDAWYARYLFTYTFTQFIDIMLWAMQEDTGYSFLDSWRIPGGLAACKEYQFSWTTLADGHAQMPNFIVTKYALPCVVFSQYAMQCTYPSNALAGWKRVALIASHVAPAAIMSFCFACTYLVPSQWPTPKDTLHWGGDWGWTWAEVAKGEKLQEYWATQIFSGLSAVHVSIVFWMLMPKRVLLMHLAVLSCVVGFQAITEGTIGLGSKWCTYCLIYSTVYCADPLWMPKATGKAAQRGGSVQTAAVSQKSGGARRRKNSPSSMGSVM